MKIFCINNKIEFIFVSINNINKHNNGRPKIFTPLKI